jgi:radical SAM superfamily enzyme YgiQ (UPF0313 family)
MKILLINPPVYDFAAYDFWMKPLGLLYLSNLLKKENHRVYLLDVPNRFDPYFKKIKGDSFGRGKIPAQKVSKPEVLKDIKGKFKRYGVPRKVIEKRIRDLNPEIVMVTCSMTYWYPGLIEIKEIIESLAERPILLLGGIYVSLIPEHAEEMGFDRIYSKRENSIEEVGIEIPEHFSYFPPPDYSHYNDLAYACLATSVGCPFGCPYCVSSYFCRIKQDKEEDQVVDEIFYLYKKGIRRFAFYDDALLMPPERFIGLCDKIKEKGIFASFFTPNGLHSRFISEEVARSMYETGFKEPRISLETSDENLQKKLSTKTSNEEFVKGVENLKKAGYEKQDIYTYLLAGAPGVSFESVERSILYVEKTGTRIALAEFSPIPKTKMEEDLPDPLFTNNTVYYHYKKKEEEMVRVKQLAKEVNERMDSLNPN